MSSIARRPARSRVGRRYQYIGFAYIAPWIIGFLAFQLYPFLASLFYSFTNFDILRAPSFVGIRNYVQMFTADQDYANSAKATALYVVMSVPLKLAFALLVAVLLNSKIRGIGAYRAVYYLPSILGGSVSVAILWRFVFAQQGLVNQLLSLVGVTGPSWIGEPGTALFTISLLAVWQFGSSMVLFLAGLTQIPTELYEAARMDGSSTVRTFFRITLPMLSPIILFNVVMQSINAFQEFSAPYLITNGGPLESTYLYGMMLYENAFQFFKMGYASALSWVLFLVILLFTLGVFRTSGRWVFYQDGDA